MKAHLVSSDDPLREGLKLFAICGAEVPNAVFQFFFRDDVYEFSQSLSTINTCEKCINAQRYLVGRFVYGIVSAKKSPKSESEQAKVAVA